MAVRLSVWSARRLGVDQLCVGEGEVALIGAARGHGEFDTPHADADERADLQELEANGTAGRFAALRPKGQMRVTDTSQISAPL